MARTLNIGGAQLGPINKSDTKKSVVLRMMELLKQAKSRNSQNMNSGIMSTMRG